MAVLHHIFAHRFADGALASVFAIFDTETGKITQQRIGEVQLAKDAPQGFYEPEFVAWHQAIDEFFIARYKHIQFYEAIEDSMERARDSWPEAFVPGTPLWQQVSDLSASMIEIDDSIRSEPDGPFRVIEIAAGLLGIKRAK